MSHRSFTFSKLKQALTQAPATRTVPSGPFPTTPVPLAGAARQPERNFTDPRQLPGLERMTASDGLTVMMPVVGPIPARDLSATQPLPVVRAAVPPPSARHVNPAPRTTTFVEDNDLEPNGRGRHVLAELRALPDPTQELAAVARRVIDDLDGPDVAAKNPAMQSAVRAFRHARDMARARIARSDKDDARLDAADARLKKFAERWAHDDAHWDRVAAALKAKQDASDAGQIAAAHAEGGTSAALYKVDELSHVIVQRARAKAGVR